MIDAPGDRPRPRPHAALADPGADARTRRPGRARTSRNTATITSSTMALLIGGVSMDDQVKKLDRGVDVLIATPGRLLDHFERGSIMLIGVRDPRHRRGRPHARHGLHPRHREDLQAAATAPADAVLLGHHAAGDHAADRAVPAKPVRIEVARPATTAKTITQRFCFCPASEDWAKREVLRHLIRSQRDHPERHHLLQPQARRGHAAQVARQARLQRRRPARRHGPAQRARETLDRFRAGEITLLVASDVAARGLDIPDVSHVFNFDVPWHSDDYVHRIGRTGRAGREGAAFSIVTLEDLKLLKDIQKITGDTAEWVGEQPTPGRLRGRRQASEKSRWPCKERWSWRLCTQRRSERPEA